LDNMPLVTDVGALRNVKALRFLNLPSVKSVAALFRARGLMPATA